MHRRLYISFILIFSLLISTSCTKKQRTSYGEQPDNIRYAASCDRLASHGRDPERQAPGVNFNKINTREAIKACEQAVAHNPDEARFKFQLGRAYYAAQKYGPARTYVQEAADKGYAHALYYMGVLYGEGRSMPRDLAQARQWYARAAEAGHAGACAELGFMALAGEEAAQDFVQAAHWFEKGAKGDIESALWAMGVMSERGLGGPRNMDKAVSLYSRGALLDSDRCRRRLGLLYELGTGVEQNQRRADDLYTEAKGADYTETPFVRLNPATHCGAVRSLSTDALGALFVTAGEDHVVRVWDAATQSLLQTIRPPIRLAGGENFSFKAALSPDGTTVAVAENGDQDWNLGYSVYVVDWRKNKILATLRSFQGTITPRFSRDGRYLALGLWEGHVQLYDTRDYTLAKTTALPGVDDGAAPYFREFDFSPSGQLAVLSQDGYLHVYDKDLTRIRSLEAGSIHDLGPISYSHDGSLLVVGSYSGGVKIFNSEDLSLRKRIWTPFKVFTVLVSRDNTRLFCAGRTQGSELSGCIYAYDIQSGRETGRFSIGLNSIQQLADLGGDCVLFASHEPIIGAISYSGKTLFKLPPETIDVRMDDLKGFKISKDGTRVSFGSPPYADRLTFELGRGITSLHPAAAPGLSPAETSAEGVHLSDFQNCTSPRLNGSALDFGDGNNQEECRSASVAADGGTFVLGGCYSLTRYTPQGTRVWRKPIDSEAWGAIITEDGRHVVAALGDGTIRWYRMYDGSEALALFVNSDRKRWIAWTPQGYYDASPGAEDMAGWHVNTGRERLADFAPLSQFRTLLHRPDVVAAALDTTDAVHGSTTTTLTAPPVKYMWPPVLSVVSPARDSFFTKQDVDIVLHMRSPSGQPIQRIRVWNDGHPLLVENGPWKVGPDGQAITLHVCLPPTDCSLSLQAETDHATTEINTPLPLKWQGYTMHPRLHLLAVGVSGYPPEPLRLQFAHQDARDFSEVMKRQQGKLFEKVDCRLLTDAQATRRNILSGLKWIQEAAQQGDVAMLFLSGHGTVNRQGRYFFYPVDVEMGDILFSGLPMSELEFVLSRLRGNRVPTLVFFDTCCAGQAGQDLSGRKGPEELIRELAAAGGSTAIFSATTNTASAKEGPDWGHGAFTKALVEGLDSKADASGDGAVSISELQAYVSSRVRELTGNNQTPVFDLQNIPDIPLAVVAPRRQAPLAATAP